MFGRNTGAHTLWMGRARFDNYPDSDDGRFLTTLTLMEIKA
jgi:hypothetical protein